MAEQKKWTIKGVSIAFRDEVNDMAKDRKVSNGQLVKEILENAVIAPGKTLKAKEIKNIADVRKSIRVLNRKLYRMENPDACNFDNIDTGKSYLPKVNINTHVFDGLVDKGKEVWSSLLKLVKK